MTLTEGFIRLDRLRFHAFHGVLPQERRTGNDYELTLRLGYPLDKAMASDDVRDTINYADVYALIRQEMEQPSALLEHVAARIAQRLFAEYAQLSSVDLLLTKKNPPMGAQCDGASVELHLINDKTEARPSSFPL